MTRSDQCRGAYPDAGQERQVAGLQLENRHSPAKNEQMIILQNDFTENMTV